MDVLWHISVAFLWALSVSFVIAVSRSELNSTVARIEQDASEIKKALLLANSRIQALHDNVPWLDGYGPMPNEQAVALRDRQDTYVKIGLESEPILKELIEFLERIGDPADEETRALLARLRGIVSSPEAK